MEFLRASGLSMVLAILLYMLRFWNRSLMASAPAMTLLVSSTTFIRGSLERRELEEAS